ncbi:hypothetical protein SEA_BOLT007_54 [Arthrobacter phage Bolt007]|uniref:Uncharacterized protein n=1 Tax=Arthrobacter phage Bolt007 TaxID=3017297 RepID=A0AA49E473_9CAUD|nr:hypothetical protein SEA_BOLT007_54 [Arthrobacter phage Bolt007]
MLTAKFDQRSNDAAIPPLTFRGLPELPALSNHVARYLKPKDLRNFTIEYRGGSRNGAVVLGGRIKSDKIRRIDFHIEGKAKTPDGHPPADPREIVPPKWSNL